MQEKRGLFGFTRGFNKNVVITGLVSFFMDASSEMVYPLAPLFLANVLGADKAIIGLIEGIAESTASILKVFSGWLSDRIGSRKWLMATGYSLAVLSRPIMAISGSWHEVLASRFIDRLGKGVRTAPRDAILAESTEAAYLARAFSLHRSMDTMGAVAGPLAAFSILGLFQNNYRLVFWISIIPGVIAVLLIVFFITEKKKAKTPAAERPCLTLRHFNWRFRLFIVIAVIFAFGNSSDAFLILKAQQAGIKPTLIPIVYLIFNLIYAFSAIPAGMAADRFGKKRIILLGLILFAFVYYGFAVTGDARVVWLLFALYGIFMGLTEGIQKAYLATIIPQDFKATAFGVYNTVVGLATLPASIIGGWLWDHVSSSATFYFGSAMAAVSAALFVAFILTEKGHPVTESSASKI
ncbi:MFS transporter [Dissulfurimicrobium hydrothermale]|uniref:MFS transporter n=1 Tax=Dissulfurimicrobium hydrothermale TaxID=1750598 RepID=UPI001EDAD1AE|nr:MFS transporter [Dissulfurimicrobium hydrothermale]UKL14031.1 MFS transporter [Dissulfurimicrobium hydrothermale]